MSALEKTGGNKGQVAGLSRLDRKRENQRTSGLHGGEVGGDWKAT